jgi:hypothetical protein
MALALFGEVDRTIPGKSHAYAAEPLHPTYREYWHRWQERAVRATHKHIGVMNTTLLHHFHGRKADRRYVDRWSILAHDPKYNWQTDVVHSAQGTIEWTHHNLELERQVRAYFEVRREDSVDWP